MKIYAQRLMSAFGTADVARLSSMSAFGGKADMGVTSRNVRL